MTKPDPLEQVIAVLREEVEWHYKEGECDCGCVRGAAVLRALQELERVTKKEKVPTR